MFCTTLVITRRLRSFVWDDARQVLLSLAAAVESDMGGSSGAVSGKRGGKVLESWLGLAL